VTRGVSYREEEPPWRGSTWGAEAPPPHCLLEQARENIGMERGMGRVVIFFLSKIDGLLIEMKRRANDSFTL
jgi:hypothetical protein